MKVVCVTLIMFILLMSLSLSVDLFAGFNLESALRDMYSPLKVMEQIEVFIFPLYLLLIVIPLFVSYFKQKRKRPN